MSYTEFDRKCDEAALGCSFSRRTRLLVWTMKRTWWLWRRSDRAKTYFAAALAKTLLAPRSALEQALEDADILISLHTSDPAPIEHDVSYHEYARQKLDDNGW